ncbi:MAG TPA: hypothetical protein VEF89_11675 [Solirubrobacteraceae bacterium]|nr:hypothetical protein [Solirubrobacteraceae bacterium]
MNASCIFGLFAKAPPPPKNPRRGVEPVPVVPVPVPPPGGAPAGRDGSLTPCCFRQATNADRRALFAPPAPELAAAVVVVVPLALLVLLELLALPQAAMTQPNASATNM